MALSERWSQSLSPSPAQGHAFTCIFSRSSSSQHLPEATANYGSGWRRREKTSQREHWLPWVRWPPWDPRGPPGSRDSPAGAGGLGQGIVSVESSHQGFPGGTSCVAVFELSPSQSGLVARPNSPTQQIHRVCSLRQNFLKRNLNQTASQFKNTPSREPMRFGSKV